MPTRISLLLVLLASPILSTGALGQPAPSTPVEVLYAVGNDAIETYNVDPQTGFPTDLGPTVIPAILPVAVPSNDGRFLYISGTDPSTGTQSIWVYATSPNGIPEESFIQRFDVGNRPIILNMHPSGRFAYAVNSALFSGGGSEILLFHINPLTGILSPPEVVAKYPAIGPCHSPLEDSTPGIVGFDPTGTKMYDEWECEFEEAGAVTFYTLGVNLATGALGPGTETFDWSISTEDSYDNVDFTRTHLIDFHSPNSYDQGINSVNIYPLTGGTSPIFSCTAAMLEACGYGTSIKVDLSGNYIFIQTSANNTQETLLNLPDEKIVATPYYVPDSVSAFSPDDKLIYTRIYGASPPYLYPIYTFDPADGALATSQDAVVYVQKELTSLVPALRK